MVEERALGRPLPWRPSPSHRARPSSKIWVLRMLLAPGSCRFPLNLLNLCFWEDAHPQPELSEILKNGREAPLPWCQDFRGRHTDAALPCGAGPGHPPSIARVARRGRAPQAGRQHLQPFTKNTNVVCITVAGPVMFVTFTACVPITTAHIQPH